MTLVRILIVAAVVIVFIVLTVVNIKTPKPLCDTTDIELCSNCTLNCVNKENGKENQ